MRATAAVPGSSAATNSRSVLITAGVATSLRAAADTLARRCKAIAAYSRNECLKPGYAKSWMYLESFSASTRSATCAQINQ